MNKKVFINENKPQKLLKVQNELGCDCKFNKKKERVMPDVCCTFQQAEVNEFLIMAPASG